MIQIIRKYMLALTKDANTRIIVRIISRHMSEEHTYAPNGNGTLMLISALETQRHLRKAIDAVAHNSTQRSFAAAFVQLLTVPSGYDPGLAMPQQRVC